jgi:hypothetical protein
VEQAKAHSTFYVDPNRVAVVLNSLLHHLNMTHAFTVFVLNPKPPTSPRHTYGYRTGFSASEIQLLSQHRAFTAHRPVMQRDTHSGGRGGTGLQSVLDLMHREVQPVDLLSGTELPSGGGLLRAVDLVAESERWARAYIAHYSELSGGGGGGGGGDGRDSNKNAKDSDKEDAKDTHIREKRDHSGSEGTAVNAQHSLGEEKTARELYLSLLPPDAPELLLRHRLEPLSGIVEVARELTTSGSFEERHYLYEVQNNIVMQENCLVDSWIGRDRWVFLRACVVCAYNMYLYFS